MKAHKKKMKQHKTKDGREKKNFYSKQTSYAISQKLVELFKGFLVEYFDQFSS